MLWRVLNSCASPQEFKQVGRFASLTQINICNLVIAPRLIMLAVLRMMSGLEHVLSES